MKKIDAALDVLYSTASAVCGVCMFSVDSVDINVRLIILVLSLFNALLTVYQAIWRLENKESLQTGAQHDKAQNASSTGGKK